MTRPIWKMYWKNGCKMTVRRMMKEQALQKQANEKTDKPEKKCLNKNKSKDEG